MRDRPGGPDEPDESDNSDQSNKPDQPGESNQGDQPREDDQQREGDQSGEKSSDQPRKWYEFELKETEAEQENRLAVMEKQKLQAEGFDNELLDELYGTDEELGIVDNQANDEPAPYKPEIAERVPDYGTRGDKTSGTVDLGESVEDLVSGYDGPARNLPRPRPGMDMVTMAHVEAHTAALMRTGQVNDATLYINRAPCNPTPRKGCEVFLPTMLPEGSKLTVYGPDDYVKVFRGQPDKKKPEGNG